jgi:hypothetical protein
MSEAQRLKDSYDKAIAELQERCEHVVTHWALEAFAPVHYTGWEVEFCDNCWKQLQKRQGTSYIVPVGKPAFDKTGKRANGTKAGEAGRNMVEAQGRRKDRHEKP